MAASVPWALNIQRAVTHSNNAVKQRVTQRITHCTKFTEKRRWRSQNFNPEVLTVHPLVNEIPFHPHKERGRKGRKTKKGQLKNQSVKGQGQKVDLGTWRNKEVNEQSPEFD